MPRGWRMIGPALLGLAAAGGGLDASATPPTCAGASARLVEDYSYVVGSALYADADGDEESGSTTRWILNGVPDPEQAMPELLLLHLDGSSGGCSGETPLYDGGVTYGPGKWGSAASLERGGALAFARAGNLDLAEGTVEMWVARRATHDEPDSRGRTNVLLHYAAPNGDFIEIAVDPNTGILFAGGTAGGSWQSAWGAPASTRSWRPGEWHHVAYAYSGSGNFMRLYLDGSLAADTNEGRYDPPSPTGALFTVAGDLQGKRALYWIDELRTSARPMDPAEIAARAHRAAPTPPLPHEVWFDTTRLSPGDSLVFEYTPSDAGGSGTPCASEPLVFPGIPLANPSPPSTLLAPGTTELSLSVESAAPTECRYALGEPLPFEEMTPFDSGSGTTEHRTAIAGLDPDPSTVAEVYVRCASSTDYLLHLRYRSLSDAEPHFPRTGNLWGSGALLPRGLPYCARIDLWLGASFDPAEIRELRRLNPDIRILTSINAVENAGLPDDYYLKDVDGNRIEVWPGSFRLNLTKPYVAEYQARFAYRRILDSDLMMDGCFFDNVMTTQSWLRWDIHGNRVRIDADEDGQEDDPAVLDAAWKAGVFHEMETFRALMPNALVSGHSMDVTESGIPELFNGISIGFFTADVIEGKRAFADLWETYRMWDERALSPAATMIESSPPDQIAYGYDYSPWNKVPPSTLEFARTYYPYVRFGLALTLMRDGYFAHEFGDTWHGNDWWYDELDFDLGYPLGPPRRVDVGVDPGPDLIVNGSFEEPIADPWRFWVNTGEGCVASVARDTTTAADGDASARVDVGATSGVDWHIEFAQHDRSLQEGTAYDLRFWAKSDAPRAITLSAQKGSPNWDNYGLWRRLEIDATWREYTIPFLANATTSEARIQFLAGETTGSIWLDQVRLSERPPDVYARKFTNGLVVLNGSRLPREIPVGPGYRRLVGDQAPRHELILDDDDAGGGFTTSGNWTETTYDSGEWQAEGPFYHDWGPACHVSSDPAAEARWSLPIPEADTYTITAWWAAAPVPPPPAGAWSANVTYEVVANGAVVASATYDQGTGGDEWHPVAEVALDPSDATFVRMTSPDAAPCMADALHVCSAARYNDGSPAARVTLQPLDGIVLQRRWATRRFR